MAVRKNQAKLTPAEKAAFVAAVKKLKSDNPGGLSTYDAFVRQHLNAFLMGEIDPAHNGPAFGPWHREYLRRFELALQRAANDPNLGLPYWDWTVDNTPNASLWRDDFMGGNGVGADQRVISGPFAFSTGQWPLVVRDPGVREDFLQRSFGGMGRLPTRADVDAARRVTPYDSAPWNFGSNGAWSFRWVLEVRVHNIGHMWVGGSMMAMASPNDPVFWLHHCNIDRLWADWQDDHRTEPYLPPSGTPGVVAGHGLDDPMPPWTSEPGPPTPRSVLEHRALGYVYDTDRPEGGPPAGGG